MIYSNNLMWTPVLGKMTWAEAKAYVEDLSYGDHSDWRLPTVGELEQVFKKKEFRTDDTIVWSSDLMSSVARAGDFKNRSVFSFPAKRVFSVRAVRDAQGLAPEVIQGHPGPVGSQGTQGLKGDVGPQGSPGSRGEAGPIGPQGSQGLKGDVGPQGSPGSRGEAGPIGPQGSQGLKGDAGPQGTRGLQGDSGPQGIRGSQGLKGDAGPQGSQGSMGEAGSIGPKGPQGSQGEAGSQGLRGLQGEPGPASARLNDALYLKPREKPPLDFETGTIYYDSRDNKLKCYDGGKWNDLF